MEESYALFDSSIGWIGLVWSTRGLKALFLPEQTKGATERSMRERHPRAVQLQPTPTIIKVIAQIQNLLSGGQEIFHGIELDLSNVSPFYQTVYELARKIPPGQTRSYGDLAQALGKKGAARAVGQALGKNPIAIIIPCHRVLGKNGSIGGFSAPGGTRTKLHLLALEQGLEAVHKSI